jgi:hypothetical protein
MINIVRVKGGLGNQMFIYAFGLSLKNRYPFYFTLFDITESQNSLNGFELTDVFCNIKPQSTFINKLHRKFFRWVTTKYQHKIIHESVSHFGKYSEVFYKLKFSLFNVYEGYWQSEKYFDKVQSELRRLYTFNFEKLSSETLDYLSSIKSTNSVSVHIRRADYLQHEDFYGGICTFEYYRNAIKYFMKNIDNPIFYFFSDDIEWVVEQFENLPIYKFVNINHSNDNWQDMYLMSQCNHNIIANSTFSWWGAWLNSNPKKLVLAPRKWSNMYENIDIYPPDWIKISFENKIE